MEHARLHDLMRATDRGVRAQRPPKTPSPGPCEARRQQLQDVFDALDAAIQLIDGDAPADALARALDDLTDYARDHFSEQERALALDEHPWYGPHRETHSAILAHLDALRHNCGRLDGVQLHRHLRFMDRWLTTHAAEEAVRMMPRCR